MSAYTDKISILQEQIKDVETFFLKKDTKHLYKHILEIVEKPLIEMVLKSTKGNQKKAAVLLGINRNTLFVKIKKLKINAKEFKDASD
ncbi:MAG: site-specific DNA inversion stimulation factor [Candidatus Omnitrophica bacterium]|nr:site-specific DNA inversion stimulation factor [Candidatus Omnitrophota bacterium]